MNDWNAQIIAEFRANGGKTAQFGDAPLVILHTRLVLQPRGPPDLFAHYLLGHNSGGNLTDRTRRILYYRLSSEDHESHWAHPLTDPLYEYAPVANAVRGVVQ